MTSGTGDRPQDIDRSHKRRGALAPVTAALLAEYQDAMRAELRAILAELEPAPAAPGLGLVAEPAKRPSLTDRARLWDLAIKLGRELGSAIDAEPAPTVSPRRTPGSTRRVDYG